MKNDSDAVHSVDETIVPALIGSFLIFALFYYSYVYFYAFDEGISAAPFAVKALKDVVYALVAGLLGLVALRARLIPQHARTSLTFVPLAIALTLTSVIHAPQTGLSVQLWQNVKNVVLFIPIFSLPFYFSRQTRDMTIRVVCAGLLVSALVQCAFVIVFHGQGGRLWLDGIYAGLLGNPNSFALLLNLAAAILLARLGSLDGRGLTLALCALGVLAYVILGTTSASQALNLVVLFAVALVFRPGAWKRVGTAALVCLSVAIVERVNVESAAFALTGSLAALTEASTRPPTDVDAGDLPAPATSPALSPGVIDAGPPSVAPSLSVSNRVKDMSDALAVLRSGPGAAMFGSFDTAQFRPMDGQFWVFLYNGGLLTLIAFSGGALLVYVRSAGDAWASRDDTALALHLMITAFGISFMASRVLMYFPFNFLFFLIAGLAMSLSFRRGS